MSDPFLNFYAQAWAAAEADSVFASLVPVGNRVKFNNETVLDVLKARIQDGDLPEVVLNFDSASVPTAFNSCASKVSARLSWALSTGDFRLGFRLTPVLWRLLVITSKLANNTGALLYDGNPYIENITPINAVVGASDAEKNRGIKGWSAIVSFEVNFILPNSALEG